MRSKDMKIKKPLALSEDWKKAESPMRTTN
jgi:hypothetical protein